VAENGQIIAAPFGEIRRLVDRFRDQAEAIAIPVTVLDAALADADALLDVKKAAEVVMQLWREDPQATLFGIPALGEALAALQEHLKKAP
jgi:hypothetical protein